MNFFSHIPRLGRKFLAKHRLDTAHPTSDLLRKCRFEEMESRRFMAADLLVGAVYYEDASGDDHGEGDIIQVTFEGGAPGTQLTHIVINGDKEGNGRSAGDVFFDTAAGGLGSFGWAPLKIVSHDGFTVLNASVVDGGSQLVIDVSGFDAGEKLILTVDVDEVQFVDPTTGELDTNAIVEGAEFQRSKLQASFIAPHFANISGTAAFFDAYDAKFASASTTSGSTLDVPNDRWDRVLDLTDRTAGAITPLEQIPLPITLAGTVFVDNNLDNDQDAGEPGIGNVKLTLLKLNGTQYVATGSTATTNAAGAYKFEGLLPGTYRVVETQPLGYFSVGAAAGNVQGNKRGVVVTSDIISAIQLLGGEDSVRNDFAEALPASISGHVHADLDGDCIFDPEESGIGGVKIDLLDAAGNVVATTLTDELGFYSFTGLAPGTYGVHEEQPAGYFDSHEEPGSAGGIVSENDVITQIVLSSGTEAVEYNFCELLPASIKGHVHADLDDDCVFDPEESGIEGVTILLLDASGTVLATTKTDADGNYQFTNLRPDTYTVHELQPAGYFDSDEEPGSAGGVVSANDVISEIVLGSGVNAVDYNFCELLPASIKGHVHADLDGDCIFDPEESGIADVRIDLLDASGNIVATTKTDADGNYEFTNLQPDTYTVHEFQPAGYFDSHEEPGSAGGVVSANDVISEIVLGSGVHAVDYNFCELLPASIQGHVHADLDGDCMFDPEEVGLEGVVIHLLDASNNVIATTLTDHHGEYSFTGLEPGTYGVREEQPAGYFDSEEEPGSAGGVVTTNDVISEVVLGSGVNAVEYNFCEIPPAELCGYVYSDLNNNGVFDAGEKGIRGVTLFLTDAQGNRTGVTATTDETGLYCFLDLKPGTYGVSEVQPAGYFDGIDTPGTAGGSAHNPGDLITGAVLKPGAHAEDYNFGELLPASIRGHVHADLDGDCVFDANEVGIAGVTVRLLDASGSVVATTLTDQGGNYQFTNLAPGTYGIREEQPTGYFDSGDHPGSAGGVVTANDVISQIVLGSAKNEINYNFCEIPPSSIAGTVFQDGPAIATFNSEAPDVASVRDGKLKPGDPRLAGVVLELRDGVTGEAILGSHALPGFYAPDSLIQTVTDANGHYEFRGLPKGNYAVFEVQPSGYLDGIDTQGSLGGIPVNPHQNVSPQILQQLIVLPNNDAILRIAVPAGQDSVDNNFSEVKTTSPFFFTVPPPPAPPLLPPTDVVLPPPRLPFIPPTFLQYLPNPIYYSHNIINYTWHLSVIDAGQPRDPGVFETVKLTSVTEHDIVAWQRTLKESEWSLASKSDDGRSQVRRLLFGMRGGIPVTGDFNGDGITDIGVFKDGQWFIDLNGNGVWDEGDLWAKLGNPGDLPVTGDWDGDGKTDIGIFGPAWPGDPRAVAAEPGLPDPDNRQMDVHKNVPRPAHKTALGVRALKRTVEGKVRADLIDHVFHYGTPKDTPIIGDWNGDGIDTIGVFYKGDWYRDTDGDGKWSESDGVAHLGRDGDIPVVGDFNGDGIDDVGVYRDGTWYLDTNGNGKLDADDQVVSLGGPGDIPVVGDWNGDGHEEPGIYHDGEVTRSVQRN